MTWTTREGIKLNINEMGISHMENCIKMLKKNYPYISYPDISGSESDGAYWAEQSMITQWGIYNERREAALLYIKEFEKEINFRNSK